MYLSKVVLTGAARRNPYEMHRALWRLFPEQPEAERDFLFRLEQDSRDGALILLQSARCPTGPTREVRVLAAKEFSLPVVSGQRLRFLLVANPVRTISDGQGRLNSRGEVKKCRVPLIRDDEQRAWLQRKLAAAAVPEEFDVDPKLPLHFRKEGMAGKIRPVTFHGTLRVEELELLHRLVVEGVGPAKAFGCGLLSLARG